MTTEHTKLSSLHTSKLVRVLVVLLVLALVFWAGMTVGYHKAEFSYRFSDNYVKTFGMRNKLPGAMTGMPSTDDLVGGHGAAGKVVSANLPMLIVIDRDGTEKNIMITSETVVRSARSTTASTTIVADDFVVVIGTPNESGGITAKLIRVMPSSQRMMYTR